MASQMNDLEKYNYSEPLAASNGGLLCGASLAKR